MCQTFLEDGCGCILSTVCVYVKTDHNITFCQGSKCTIQRTGTNNFTYWQQNLNVIIFLPLIQFWKCYLIKDTFIQRKITFLLLCPFVKKNSFQKAKGCQFQTCLSSYFAFDACLVKTKNDSKHDTSLQFDLVLIVYMV